MHVCRLTFLFHLTRDDQDYKRKCRCNIVSNEKETDNFFSYMEKRPEYSMFFLSQGVPFHNKTGSPFSPSLSYKIYQNNGWKWRSIGITNKIKVYDTETHCHFLFSFGSAHVLILFYNTNYPTYYSHKIPVHFYFLFNFISQIDKTPLRCVRLLTSSISVDSMLNYF